MLDFEYEDQISLLHHYHNPLVTTDLAVLAQSGGTAHPGTTASSWSPGPPSWYLALGILLCQALVAMGNCLPIALLFPFIYFKEETLL